MQPKWLTPRMVRAIHAEVLAAFGGASGVRDEALLDSAIERPRNLWAYADKPTIYELAAAYCVGIIRNHPVIDGNKRAGLLVARAFLFLNGYVFEPEEVDEVNLIIALAAGEIDEPTIATWLSDYSTRRRDV